MGRRQFNLGKYEPTGCRERLQAVGFLIGEKMIYDLKDGKMKIRVVITLLLANIFVLPIYGDGPIEHTTSNLSQPRWGLSATSTSRKAIFAGGSSNEHGYVYGDRVDIHTNSWTATTFSEPRTELTATSAGTKVIFAGGEYTDINVTDRVDIYDTQTGQWLVAALSEACSWLSAATIGNKAFFAGGATSSTASNVVDIYDADANSWSTKTLTCLRFGGV